MTKSLTFRAFLLFSGNILQKASSFLLVFFLVRLVDKSDYGTYQQVFYIGAILYGLFVSGISSSLYYFIPRKKTDVARGEFVRQTLMITIILGLVSGIVLVILSKELSSYLNNPILHRYLKYYSIYVIFWIGSDYFINFLNSYNKYYHSMLFAAAESAVNMIAVLVPVYITGNLEYSFIALMCVGFIRYLVYLSLTLSITGWFTSDNPLKGCKEQIGYSLPLMFSGWSDLIGLYVDKVVVSVLYSPAILAIYAVGTIRIPIWDILVKPINVVLRVKFTELIEHNEMDKVFGIWNQAVRKQAIIIFPILFLLWTLAEPMFTLFFTEKYHESISIFRVFLLDKPILAVSLSVFPLCMGRSDILFKGSIIFAISNLILVFALVHPMKMYGPVTSVVLSQYIHAGFYVYMIRKHLNIPMAKLFPRDILTKSLLANIIASVVAYVASKLSNNLYVEISVGIIVFITVYILLLIYFKLLRRDEIRAMATKMKFIKVS